MDTERIFALIAFSLLHLLLAGMLLQDLVNRKRVLGGRKAPWAIVILFITFVGPLLYLLCHPRIFYGSDNE
ncbi:MAG: PLDc N-terminal domain-containing protein [Chloroflexota bacterium]